MIWTGKREWGETWNETLASLTCAAFVGSQKKAVAMVIVTLLGKRSQGVMCVLLKVTFQKELVSDQSPSLATHVHPHTGHTVPDRISGTLCSFAIEI